MKIKVTKALMALKHLTSDDGTRAALQNVLVEPDGTAIATDGHIMMWMTDPKMVENAGGEDTLVPASFLSRILKALSRDHIYSFIKASPKRTKLTATSDEGTDKGFRISEDTPFLVPPYPAWRQVFPEAKDKDYQAFAVGVPVLKKLLKFAEASKGMFIHIYAPIAEDRQPGTGLYPVTITGLDQTFHGCIMPIQVNSDIEPVWPKKRKKS